MFSNFKTLSLFVHLKKQNEDTKPTKIFKNYDTQLQAEEVKRQYQIISSCFVIFVFRSLVGRKRVLLQDYAIVRMNCFGNSCISKFYQVIMTIYFDPFHFSQRNEKAGTTAK